MQVEQAKMLGPKAVIIMDDRTIDVYVHEGELVLCMIPWTPEGGSSLSEDTTIRVDKDWLVSHSYSN
jgi:hypothetical protein